MADGNMKLNSNTEGFNPISVLPSGIGAKNRTQNAAPVAIDAHINELAKSKLEENSAALNIDHKNLNESTAEFSSNYDITNENSLEEEEGWIANDPTPIDDNKEENAGIRPTVVRKKTESAPAGGATVESAPRVSPEVKLKKLEDRQAVLERSLNESQEKYNNFEKPVDPPSDKTGVEYEIYLDLCKERDSTLSELSKEIKSIKQELSETKDQISEAKNELNARRLSRGSEKSSEPLNFIPKSVQALSGNRPRANATAEPNPDAQEVKAEGRARSETEFQPMPNVPHDEQPQIDQENPKVADSKPSESDSTAKTEKRQHFAAVRGKVTGFVKGYFRDYKRGLEKMGSGVVAVGKEIAHLGNAATVPLTAIRDGILRSHKTGATEAPASAATASTGTESKWPEKFDEFSSKPYTLLNTSPLETKDATNKIADNDQQLGSAFEKQLEGHPPLRSFLRSTSDQLQDLSNNVVVFMKNLGVKTGEARENFTYSTVPNSMEKPPVFEDLESLDDNREYTVAQQGDLQVVYTGKEIKEMASSAQIWNAGNREGEFVDPGLTKGLVLPRDGNPSNSLEMSQVMVFSKMARPIVDCQNRLVERFPDDPGHFECLFTAPDLTSNEVKPHFQDEEGRFDMEKIRKYIDRAVGDFIGQSEENGVEVLNIPAAGLGAFATRSLTDEQKKEYAQIYADSVKSHIKEGSCIKLVNLSGAQFVSANLDVSSGKAGSLAIVVTDNEITNLEITAGEMGLKSASIIAGDQNKVSGFHAFGDAVAALKANNPNLRRTGDVVQDEINMLRNPLALLLSPINNSFLQAKLKTV